MFEVVIRMVTALGGWLSTKPPALVINHASEADLTSSCEGPHEDSQHGSEVDHPCFSG
jgi:hypothetical protein